MTEAVTTRCFVSYSGIDLPLNLVNPLEDTENRITFFRAHYDAQERMVLCEKVVYGEIEFTHRYEYYPDGTLQRAEITDEDEEVQVLAFDEQGQRV